LKRDRFFDNQTRFHSYDGHGSVRYLTDPSGAVTDAYAYDAFGSLVARTGSTPNDYLYAGERFDAEAGFYYPRAGYMSLSSGRFLTKDNSEGVSHDPATLHKYLYANADPANRVDLSGHYLLTMTPGGFAVMATVYRQQGRGVSSSPLTAATSACPLYPGCPHQRVRYAAPGMLVPVRVLTMVANLMLP
jgi:RHS repeat-associated protein